MMDSSTLEEVGGRGGRVEVGIGSFMTKFLKCDYDDAPAYGYCRKYRGTVQYEWEASRGPRFCDRSVTFEIKCRAEPDPGTDQLKKRVKFSSVDHRHTFRAGQILTTTTNEMPQLYAQKLKDTDSRWSAAPMWDSFDFSGVVHVLSTWLSTLTWWPDLYLTDLLPISDWHFKVCSDPRLKPVMGAGKVFIHSSFHGNGSIEVYHTMVAACVAAGAEVYVDTMEMHGDRRPIVCDSQGSNLAWAINECLRVLACLYDESGNVGPFTYAFFKGLHTASTVVAHSDEGGILRDIIRKGRFDIPYGGLPSGCRSHSEIPIIDPDQGYRAVAAQVDSYLLASAALVAQCAPLITPANGKSRPAIFMGGDPKVDITEIPKLVIRKPKPGTSPEEINKMRAQDELEFKLIVAEWNNKRLQHCRRILTNMAAPLKTFAGNYLRSLAYVLGFKKDINLNSNCGSWMNQGLQACAGSDIANRHLCKNEVVAPFFWIEPSCLIPRVFTRCDAESEGWASLGRAGETVITEMFPDATIVGQSSCQKYDVEIEFKGARQAPWIHCLAGAVNDGLANINFKQLSTSQLMCVGGLAAEEGTRAAFLQQAPVAEYLWVRGQSRIPHPSECAHADNRAVVTIRLMVPDEEDKDKINPDCYPHVEFPIEDRLCKAKVKISFTRTASINVERQCVEPRRLRGQRTDAERAYRRALYTVFKDGVIRRLDTGLLDCAVVEGASQQRTVTVDPTRKRTDTHTRIDGKPSDTYRYTPVCESRVDKSEIVFVAPMPVRYADAVVNPMPQQPVVSSQASATVAGTTPEKPADLPQMAAAQGEQAAPQQC